MSNLTYWDRLKSLKLYSLQWRRERYIVIYVQKIVLGLVPNVGIRFNENERTGIYAIGPQIKPTLPSKIRSMRNDSFVVVAPRLYNLLPEKLRRKTEGLHPILSFKTTLDHFLSKIPDEPTVNGLSRPAESNSLFHQVHYSQNW